MIILGVLLFLVKTERLYQWLTAFLFFNFIMMLCPVGLILWITKGTEINIYYAMIVPLTMIWYASFYLGRSLGIAALLFVTVLAFYLIGQGNAETATNDIQLVYNLAGASIAFAYNFAARKMRGRIVLNDLKLSDQTEALTENLLKLQEHNELLSKKRDTLVAQLHKLQKQIPKGLQVDMEELFKSADLLNEADLDQQVFSQRQLSLLIERELTRDQILLLSGLALNLEYKQIQQKLFPHLSIRSLENMASKIRKQLNLPRGSDLSKVFETI